MDYSLLIILIFHFLLILASTLIVPYVLYKTTKHDENSFSNWIDYIGMSSKELIFIIINLCLILIFNQLTMLLGLIIASYIIIYVNFKAKKEFITQDKKFLPAFLVIFVLYFTQILLSTRLGYINNQNTLLMNTLYLLPINMTILLIFIFKISFKDFNWKLSKGGFCLVILLYLVLKPLTFIIFDLESLASFSWKSFGINFLYNIYYPAFIEEFVFRGLLLTGLIHYGYSNEKANILHAILFGIIHIMNRDAINIAFFLSTSMQVYVGYLLGKLYLTTKSLTPNILLHALFNVI